MSGIDGEEMHNANTCTQDKQVEQIFPTVKPLTYY